MLPALLLALAACGDDAPAVPAVSEARGFAALAPGAAAVVYFTLHNPTDRPLAVTAVDSPLFARVELHETVLADGVARMRRLDWPVLGAGTEFALEPGGRHLMLVGPHAPVAAGTRCPLNLHFADGGELALTVELAARTGTGPGDTPP
mgnify:CR=1 FL=1